MSDSNRGNLGTFSGVFTPSVLTILGLILFLRLGYVVGQSGLAQTLIIIAIANSISILTSMSLSAIATNLQVKRGGDYYLISRTLGMEFGGAIGVVLFLAQAISVGFYCIGFGEAVSSYLSGFFWATPQIIAFMAVAVLFIVAWLGADVATKFQFLVMSALGIALCSFFVGGILKWDTSMLVKNWDSPGLGKDFWVVFAIFFPAVTGFTQGISMSGDLKDPGKSLPLGTFAAVGVSIVVYLCAAIVFSATLPLDYLKKDYNSMQQVATTEVLISIGVIAATLSSAIASFMGAPRILQALSADRIFPFLQPFAHGAGPVNNPRRGVLFSGIIAVGIIALGNLNLIAPLVSMFFLISYGLLNYATYYEARIASPSFRPRFRFYDYRLSLIGALACLGVMLAVNLYAGLVAITLVFAIYQYLLRTAAPAGWADSKRSYHLQQIREHLLAAAKETEHPRHWRPQILAFTDDPQRREQLLLFAHWLEGKSGLTTVVKIVQGEGVLGLKKRSESIEELIQSVQQFGTKAFPLVVAAPDVQTGVFLVLQGYGVGPFQGNTVLLNWFQADLPKGERFVDPARNLRMVFRLGYNIVMLDAREGKWSEIMNSPLEQRRIDIWWWGGATSRLMLLLAYLMTRDEEWRETSLRVFAVAKEEYAEDAQKNLRTVLENYRIDAESEVVMEPHAHSIVKYSKDASLVFIPFTFRYNKILGPFADDLEWLLVRLPVAALVLAAEDIDLDAEPEEGEVADKAQALQELEEARKKTQQLEKETLKAFKVAAYKHKEVESARACGIDKEGLRKKESEAKEAKENAEKAARRTIKAKTKQKEAEKGAKKFDVSISENGKDSKEEE